MARSCRVPSPAGPAKPYPAPNGSCSAAGSSATALPYVAGVILILLIILCFGAKYFAFYDKNEQNLLLGPVSPNAAHWFGTDQLGRDTLTEMLYAGQISLKIGIAVALLSTVVGTATGAIAGFFGGWVDQLLMRLTDLFLVVPAIAILAIALRRFGQTDDVIILVLAGLGWMYVARVVRGQVLAVKEKEFVEAAERGGRVTRAHHHSSRHPQLHWADPRECHSRHCCGNRDRVHLVLPRVWRPATGDVLGQHALGGGGQLQPEHPFAVLPRFGDFAHRAVCQLPR